MNFLGYRELRPGSFVRNRTKTSAYDYRAILAHRESRSEKEFRIQHRVLMNAGRADHLIGLRS